MTLLTPTPPVAPPTPTLAVEVVSSHRELWVILGLVAAVVVFAATAWMYV